MRLQTTLIILLACVSMFSCSWGAHSQLASELRLAYERSQVILMDARINHDSTLLSEAFTQNNINVIENAWEYENDSTFTAPEITVIWLKVVEYDPPEAIVEVKYFYRGYEYNRKTGTMVYLDEPQKYWRIVRDRMRFEDEKWKLDESLELVDWSR
jgi:hypothetical protein